MRQSTCFFSGCGEISASRRQALARELDGVVERLIEQGMQTFCCGGSRGFDLLAAQAVLRARERHPAIRLRLVLALSPCGRDEEETAAFADVLCRADEVEYLSGSRRQARLDRRNRRLICGSSLCVCFGSAEDGAAALAQQLGLPVVRLEG